MFKTLSYVSHNMTVLCIHLYRPLLYLIYINDLPVVSKSLLPLLFADDKKLPGWTKCELFNPFYEY